jgi:hypothetical protein
LISLFFGSQTWTYHKEALDQEFTYLGPALLKELVLAASSFQYAIHKSFVILLQNLQKLSLQNFAELVELISLTISDPELAMDILLECLEPETKRLLVGSDGEVEQFAQCLMGVALNHIDEASGVKKFLASPIELKLEEIGQDGYQIAKANLRVDAPRQLHVGDHVRMRPSQPPQNSPLQQLSTVDAIVIQSDLGTTTFRCLHRLPSYAKDCLWEITGCISFVTSKAMFDAVVSFYSQKEDCCALYPMLEELGSRETQHPQESPPFKPCPTLNSSQNRALEAAMTYPCALIWGPPNTGKTLLITVILERVQDCFENMRLLVTAPTHKAVDKLMRGYIARWVVKRAKTPPLRVSTRVSLFQPFVLNI